MSHDSVAKIFKEYLYPPEKQWKIHEINHKKKALQVYTKSKKKIMLYNSCSHSGCILLASFL